MPSVRFLRDPSRRAVVAALVIMASAVVASAQGELSFPFDRELLLDVPPVKGSKRVPSLDIGANGAAQLDLWCNTVRAQLIVVGDTITVLTGPRTQRPCSPELAREDEEMLAALTDVTNWRRQGDVLLLTGPRAIRFRLQTN